MNKRNRDDVDLYPSIFSTSYDIAQLWAVEGEVEKFANEKDDAKEELCGLEEIDNINSLTFKAGSEKNRKVSNRFDEEGVFSINCARHGVPIRLYDIYNGEGRKYALAAISHLISLLGNSQKLLIMYDIICLCKGKLESCIPGLKERAPLYLVTVFHAYAHSMHCQVQHHPRVVNGSGNTERFWSTANRFISLIRQMSKFNRKSLLPDVVYHFRQNKMLEIPGQILKKYTNAMKKVSELDITNEKFSALEKQWSEHVEIAMIPATPAGVQTLIDKAEQETHVSRYSYYLKLTVEYLLLDDLRDESGRKIEITTRKDINRNNFLVDQIKQLQSVYGYAMVNCLDDPALQEHRERTIEVRYNVMNTFVKHLFFAILMKEHKISQPGSFSTAKAARVISSLEILKKKAEAIISMINKFVETSYSTHAEIDRRKKKTVGKEVERIRLYAAENGLDLPTPLNNWHILKRNVEEISILIGEAKRVLGNYEDLSDDENEIYDNNEDDVVDAGDPADADPGEGGEPNPEDEILIIFQDIVEGS
ncbi:deoxycytidyl transferase [Mucor velutinosus]|uniref:Deoxycytidyl transferase n=1 Tax=Mucor velutinosus TaxID=708070 RepID=A0AAN7HP50_9FUNG|nr:deoxycytidyl transferase [Mucor velutinosus]